MTTTERLNSIAERIDAKKTERARAGVTFDAAEEAYNDALEYLKTEFKVSTLEEAEELLERLREKTDAQATEAEEKLSD